MTSKTVEEEPYHYCMIMAGNKVRCYPMVNDGMPEIEYKTSDQSMVGAMCLRVHDFEMRQKYITEIEERLKDE